MALQYNLKNNVLEVIETIHGWKETKVSHWYYDIESWKVSSHGKQGDIPDRPMTQNSIDWVKKYYLPKVA